VHLLKPTPEQPSVTANTDTRPRVGDDQGRVLACAACQEGITTAAARIEVAGAHEHHFTNPQGYKFHIGCFSRAPGCRGSGEPSTEFTWFPGYSWQVEGCARCASFLGWRYRAGDHRFHGLILDKLVELDPPSS
jgi:hypothetical protein